MTTFDDIYGTGPFLKPSDIKANGPIQVTIANIEFTRLRDQRTGEERGQAVLYFTELPDKRLGLNFTNGQVIKGVYGDDFSNWIGRPIVLFVQPGATPQGVQDRIFVQVPQQQAAAPAAPMAPQVPAAPQSMEQAVYQGAPVAPPATYQAPGPGGPSYQGAATSPAAQQLGQTMGPAQTPAPAQAPQAAPVAPPAGAAPAYPGQANAAPGAAQAPVQPGQPRADEDPEDDIPF